MPEVTIERLGLAGDGDAALIGPPASGRVSPPCRHFGVCGGCSLQHAADDSLAGWKGATIARALAARGLEAPIRPTVTSPARSRRRAVFGGRRTRKGALVGLHARRSDDLVDLAECLVVRPEILAAKPALERVVAIGATRSGSLRMAVTFGPAGLDVDVGGGRPLDPRRRLALAGVAEEADLARLSWAGETVSLRRPPFHVMGAARVIAPPGAFLQATAEGEAALVASVLETAAEARRVADLFAGCGTFTLPLSARAEVLAVEGDAAMLSALAHGWRGARGLRRVEAAARDLFRRPLIPAELKGLDAVVIDPPRAGAAAQCLELSRSRIGRVASVSCSPTSFARDARLLVDGGFRLDWVQPVDQFRWSGHVELAAQFSR